MNTNTQINGTEINPQLCSQSMTKKARIYNGVKTVYSINDLGKSGKPHAKKMKLDGFLTP